MSASGTETEIKLRFPAPGTALNALKSLGFAVSRARVFEGNDVYDTPAGSLRNSQQLLRLRTVGDAGVLTWKGPAAVAVHKTRPEVETGVSDPSSCGRILRELGFSPVFRYEKYRTELTQPSGSGIATIDETPIGCFVELEGAPDWIDTVAERLGFTRSDYITASYARLYTQACEASGRPVESMIFPTE